MDATDEIVSFTTFTSGRDDCCKQEFGTCAIKMIELADVPNSRMESEALAI